MLLEFQEQQIFKWLLNPTLYLVVAVLLLLSWWRHVEPLNRRFWVHVTTDFVYGVMYTLVYFPLIAGFLVGVKYATDTWAPWLNLGLADYMPIVLQFLVVVLLDDLLSYWSHYLRHRVRFLWYFHAVHHSQERLNPFSTKRFHPLENLFDKVAIKWLPLAMLGSSVEVWVMYYLLDAAWDYFIHSNLRISLGPFRKWIVGPQYHRVHHSRLAEHVDKNFADRFVIWDRLFGTACLDPDTYPPTGLRESGFPQEQRVGPLACLHTHLQQLAYPFRMIAKGRRGDKTDALASGSTEPNGHLN